MKCPLCEVSMKEVERRGVLIDVCPECKGVWLDKGELEKLLLASREHVAERHSIEPEEYRPQTEHYYKDDYYYKHKKHKRKSFLEDIFDIFD